MDASRTYVAVPELDVALDFLRSVEANPIDAVIVGSSALTRWPGRDFHVLRPLRAVCERRLLFLALGQNVASSVLPYDPLIANGWIPTSIDAMQLLDQLERVRWRRESQLRIR